MNRILVLLILTITASITHAATGLATICAAPTDLTAVKYATPSAGDHVRAGTDWGNYVCQEWGALAVGTSYEVCDTDIPDPTNIPIPWTADDDKCKTWATGTKTQTSVTFSWTAPTHNTDGTPLTNLHGYRLYTGTIPTIFIPGSVTSKALPTTVGTAQYTLTALNDQCAESDKSPVLTGPTVAAAPSVIPQPPSGSISTSTQGYVLTTYVSGPSMRTSTMVPAEVVRMDVVYRDATGMYQLTARQPGASQRLWVKIP